MNSPANKSPERDSQSRSPYHLMPILLMGGILIALAVGAWMRDVARRREALRADTEAAIRARDWQPAMRLAESWLTAEPDSDAARLALGTVAIRTGDPARALDVLRKIRTDFDRFEEALEDRIPLEFREGNNPDGGLDDCRLLRERQPGNRMARFYEMTWLAFTLQHEALDRHCREAINDHAESPEHYAWLILLDDLQVRNGAEICRQWTSPAHPQLLERALAAHEVIEAINNLNNVNSPENRERVVNARKVRDQLAATFPEDPVLLVSSIRDAISNGDVDRVAELLSRVPDSSARDPMFWRFRGWYHLTRNELAEAEAALLKAVELNPLSWHSYGLLADVQRRQSRLEEATVSQALAGEGAAIEETLTAQTNLSDVKEQTLNEILKFVRNCGDHETARGLSRRLVPSGFGGR